MFRRLNTLRPAGVVVCLALTVLLVLSGSGSKVGYAVLTVEDDNLVVGTALFAVRSSGILISEAGVAAVAPIERGRIFVDQRNTLTALAIANPGDASTEIVLTLRDALGSEVATLTETLEAREHTALYVHELFDDVEEGFTGSMTFESVTAVAAVTLRQGVNVNGELLFATLPLVNLDEDLGGRERLVFPHIGAGSILSTQLILINRSNSRSSGTVRLTSSSGEPLSLEIDGVLASEFPYTLEPNGTFTSQWTLASGLGQGYAEVLPDDGSTLPAGTAIFQFTDGQGGVFSEAGVGAVEPTTRARLFIDAVDTQTGVAMANLNETAVDVTLRLLDRNGNLIRSINQPIPARGHTAGFADIYFDDIQAGVTNFAGVMELECPDGIIPISLKLTTNERRHVILTTLPLVDLDNPPAAGLYVFPQIGFVSIPSLDLVLETRLILLTASDGPAQGSLDFFASSGADLPLEIAGEDRTSYGYQISGGGEVQIRPEDPFTPSAIVVDSFEPDLVELSVVNGEVLHLAPYATDGLQARDDFEFTFSSIDPEVATVDANGMIRGLQSGFSTIAISGGGQLMTVPLSVVTLNSGPGAFTISGVVQDLAQRLYLVSPADHTVLLTESLEEEPEVYAGSSTSAGFRDDLREDALFSGPRALAFNQATEILFVSDSDNHSIRIVAPGGDGEVSTLTGTGQPGHRDGALAQAEFNNPQSVALDGLGNLWVADSGNHVIRRINLDEGTVETLAGIAGSPGSADGSGANALFDSPTGLALENEALDQQLERELNGDPPPPITFLVADTGNGMLRRVTEDGEVTTVGSVAAASRAEGLSHATAPILFNAPNSVASDPFGNIYVSEPETGRLQLLLENGNVIPLLGRQRFSRPQGIAISQGGRIVVADGESLAREIVLGAPTIREFTPDLVSSLGGTEVTLVGRNFAPGTIVLVAGRRAQNVVVVNSSTITFDSPAVPSGTATLTILNRGGVAQSAIKVAPPPLAALQLEEITTYAGGTTFAGEGLSPETISIDPAGAAFDQAGNIYVSDGANNRVRLLPRSSETISTFAGNGVYASLGDDGLAISASLRTPTALAFDTAGNLAIAESDGHRVRLVSPRGFITTIAGTGAAGFSGDGGPAIQAKLSSPRGLAFDSQGHLYIADTGNHRVRRVHRQTGRITTVVGDGVPRFMGEGIVATEASIRQPRGLDFDAKGNLYIADSLNGLVRVVSSQGIIRTAAGNGQPGPSVDGPATQVPLGKPLGVSSGRNGFLYIADGDFHQIRRLELKTGQLTTVAGTGSDGFSGDGGLAVNAELSAPIHALLGPSENLIILDRGNFRLRQVKGRQRIIESVGGNGSRVFLDDQILRIYSLLNRPGSMARAEDGRVFIADAGRNLVRRVDPTSDKVKILAGTGEPGNEGDGGPGEEALLATPEGVALDGNQGLLIADTGNHRVRRLDLVSGEIEAFAGSGSQGPPVDGIPAVAADLRTPSSLAVTTSGVVFIADSDTDTIRRVDPNTDLIDTVAGTGSPGYSGDSGPATQAQLDRPVFIALQDDEFLLITDRDNHAIRRLNLTSGIIETICGTGEPGKATLGAPAASSPLRSPRAAVADEFGNIYISDSGNNRILRIDSTDLSLRLVGGTGAFFPLGDGGAADEASFISPRGLMLLDDLLLVIDWERSRIRAIKIF